MPVNEITEKEVVEFVDSMESVNNENMTSDEVPNEETEPKVEVIGGNLPNIVVDITEPPTFDFTVTFTGDVMIASYKNQTTAGSFNEYSGNKEPTYFLEKVYPIFAEDDYTIVNLENVLTDSALKEVAKDHNPAYWYRSKTSNTNILTSSSVECVSLANNHYGDYGNQGRKDTVAAVENAGLLYGHNDKTFYIEKNGYKIAVICHGLWGEWQADAIISRIKEAETQSDFQIVYYHGGKERIHSPEEWKIRASRKLVDNGADLVVGNHPHVLQPMETYNGVDIIYSMGNFCFGGSKRPENRTIIYQFTLTINTEGEIVNAIRRSLGAKTLDGIKRRTRAGMGRCQSGFCSPKIVGILARELNVSPDEITKLGGNSYFLDGINKEE